jgi:hypothetical protein
MEKRNYKTKEFCKKGHLLEETRRRHPNGDTYCYLCKKDRSINWHKNNKDKVKNFYKKANYKRYYGISLEEVNEILFKQNFKCSICKSLLNVNNGEKGFAIDHCHKNKEVRGILCMHCNTGLGLFKDNIFIMIKAIVYLFLSKAGKSRRGTKKK